jgi:formylglycine-generating enzyme required for sulfatase activity
MGKYALLIGVSQYEEAEGFKPLPSAVEDVKAVRRMLLQQGEFPAGQVFCLENPSKPAVEEALYRLFNQRKSGDLVLFFFSGHGVRHQTGELYFAIPETRKDENGIIEHTAIAASALQQRMERAASATQILVLDCCFSGAFAKGYIGKDDSSVDIKAQLGGKGRAIFTSSGALEYSFHKEGASLSVYTHFWVEGVETGAADRDKDGLISVDELHTYVAQKVKQAAPGMTPQFFSEEKGQKIFIARSPVRSESENLALKYRELVESLVKRGSFQVAKNRFSVPARRTLGLSQTQLKLDDRSCEAIEAEVLQPIHEYQQNLAEYRQALEETLEDEGYPFCESTFLDLQEYAIGLGLCGEDVEAIELEVLPQAKLQGLFNGSIGRVTLAEREALADFFASEPLADFLASEPLADFADLKDLQLFNSFTLDLSNGVQLEMIAIPGGSFCMGPRDGEGYYDNARPRHQVTIAPFWMSKYPITQAQYQAVMGKNPSYFKGDRRPVERVSWHDAIAFCEKLRRMGDRSFRLPSEAEWEYACRAGTGSPFYFGDTISREQVNHEQHYKQTTDVGKFPSNTFGLHDMHGNVWEWCADHWHKDYQGAPIDGSAWKTSNDSDSRLLRGGSWSSIPDVCRSAARNRNSPVNANSSIGFRVACS